METEHIQLFYQSVFKINRNQDLSKTENSSIEQQLLSLRNNPSNQTTNNLYVLDSSGFEELKNFCQTAVDLYVDKIMRTKNSNIQITQSWLNLTKEGEGHHEHAHGNSVISGVFCVKENTSGLMILKNPIRRDFTFEVEEWNLHNCQYFNMPILQNQLILFPSFLEHSVSKVIGSDRITLAFNSFPKGAFGNRYAMIRE